MMYFPYCISTIMNMGGGYMFPIQRYIYRSNELHVRGKAFTAHLLLAMI